jgi:hypothetical protein
MTQPDDKPNCTTHHICDCLQQNLADYERALEFYANRDNYDRDGQLAHYEWYGEPHLSKMKDCWIDYGFSARKALEKWRPK